MHKCKCRCELYSNPIPKTTPHKKLSAGLDLKEKKNNSVWLRSSFPHGNQKMCPLGQWFSGDILSSSCREYLKFIKS